MVDLTIIMAEIYRFRKILTYANKHLHNFRSLYLLQSDLQAHWQTDNDLLNMLNSNKNIDM